MIAYILGEFPSRSEYFILNEMLSLQQKGIRIQVLAIRKAAEPHEVKGSEKIDVIYHKPFFAFLAAHIYCLFLARGAWFTTLGNRLRDAGWSLKALLKAGKDFSMAAWFLYKLRDCPPTHIHAHFLSLPARIAGIMSALSGIPFSISGHAQDIYTARTADLQQLLQASKFTITCTAYNKTFLDRQIPACLRNKIVAVYHGLDTRKWGTETMRGPQPGSRAIRILTIGRLVEKKGIIYLLQAIKELKTRNYQVKCSVIGEGPLYDQLDSYIKAHHLTKEVTLLGGLGQDALRPYYQDADLFVLPCIVAANGDRDGIPNVLVESLAMGIPVITTPTSAIPELIIDGQTGILIKEKDSKGIADAVIRLLQTPDFYKRLQVNGRKKVEEEFDLDNSATRLADLFRLYAGEKACS